MAENKLKPQRVGSYSYHDIILGKGNFATVYLARHKIIECDVALKVINLDDIEEEYVARNLTREARILRDLRHPNIVRLYETVKSINLYCLALELVRGVNLYQYLKKKEGCRISEKLARVYFYQMLSAVEHMHRLHIIHRDLKQENVLVESGHVIKIVDFGLSNIYYPSYKPRTHCGSVEYAAPELFRSHLSYDTAVDMWSLGVILYAMVVGKMPFKFNREESNCPESSTKRERFVQRISKGLMQGNWELMEDLSPDCWNLLHDLLQPDQFRRIHIEDALTHHWITKDVYLKKHLPQKRKDLERKFIPEIIEYMAEKLKTSKAKIETHVYQSSGGKIACMFYIIRDELIKDILYPPRNFETSFLYRFNFWRQNRSSLLSVDQNTEISEYEDEEDANQSKGRETTGQKSVLPKNVHGQPSLESEVDIPVSVCNSKAKGDFNYTPSKDPVKKIVARKETGAKVFSRNSCTSKIEVPEENTEQKSRKYFPQTFYRSYRSSRPGKSKKCRSAQRAGCKLPDVKSNSDSIKIEENCEKKLLANQPHELIGLPVIPKKNPQTSRDYEESAKSKNEDYSKIKILTNKDPKNTSKDGINSSCMKDQKKSLVFTIKSTSESKNNSSQKMKDITTREVENEERISRPIRGSAITLLTRKQRSVETPEKNNEIQKIISTKTPSRIPIKNMRYGPPAAFAQSSHALKNVKSKRKTVAERIGFCREDTNQK